MSIIIGTRSGVFQTPLQSQIHSKVLPDPMSISLTIKQDLMWHMAEILQDAFSSCMHYARHGDHRFSCRIRDKMIVKVCYTSELFFQILIQNVRNARFLGTSVIIPCM